MSTSPPLRKAIIPAAGLGTRMLPAAKAIPKELLPILDKPVLQYVVEECAGAGIDDVLLITSPTKHAVEAHFRANRELEERLNAGGKGSLLAGIDDLIAKVRFNSVQQIEQRGLGHAVLCARDHVGNDACLCLLGDTIFAGEPSPASQLRDAYAKFRTSVIGLEEVAPERVSRYGIVGGAMIESGVIKVDTLVEKPTLADAPSRLAIAARYVLTPRVFECLARTAPGKGGEIQLTDALTLLLRDEPIHGVVLRATRHDVGNPLDWLKTNLTFAKRDAKLWMQIAPLVRALLDA